MLKGKVAVVSGSTRGIGKAIAVTFLREGAVVYLTGRDPDQLNRACQQFRKDFPDTIRSYCGDLTQTKIIQDMMGVVCSQDGGLDIAVANIGSGRSKPGWNVDDTSWQACMEKNFYSSVKFSRECLKVMVPRSSGNIIFISSIAGCEVINAPVPYAVAKAALLSYVKYTAQLVGREGIRMNAISPGNILFDGGTWNKKLNENHELVREYIQDNVPLQRFGKPEDIARLACYLASDDASFVTGANFIIDGGQTRGM
ncbi:SDR family NAD(P)-dependent oxidoreductase [Methanoregula sp.]|uniref:SDR family NAD(P)-dependent oxidoreductase n=1 Tax=Methanoregula sp. TaxID=2052170 RepID=UPI00356A4EA0